MRALWLLLALPAHALEIRTDPPARCAMSDAVVVAEVTSTQSGWVAGPVGGIATTVDVDVSRVAHGHAPTSLQIVLPGGRADGYWQWVEDVPALTVDHRYLLYLRAGDDGTWGLVGGEASAVALRFGPDGQADEAAAIAALGSCDAR